ncbi:MAG: hypothetical protein DWG76_06545 [Chloroflexi bacterium]|nr:hypothetical protein [Chloroflexota bacterium]
MNKLSVPEPEELAGLRAKTAHRREYLGILEMELFNTRAALQEFTDEYTARLGPLEIEYQRLERLMDEAIEEDELGPGSAQGHNGHREQQSSQEQPGPERRSARQALKIKNPNYERKIRELFRNLAKRFHPDLASKPEEKEAREKIMARINQAYSARDLRTLETLAKEHAALIGGTAEGPAAELARLKIELRELEAMIFEVEHTIRELDFSPAWQMRSEVQSERQAGRDKLGDMQGNVKERIAELREHLLDLGVNPKFVNA